MTPLERSWDAFFRETGIVYFYKPQAFTINDGPHAPSFWLCFDKNEGGYWVDVKPDWPLEKRDCDRAIELCRSGRRVIIIAGNIGFERTRVVLYSSVNPPTNREELEKFTDGVLSSPLLAHWFSLHRVIEFEENWDGFFLSDLQRGFIAQSVWFEVCDKCEKLCLLGGRKLCQCDHPSFNLSPRLVKAVNAAQDATSNQRYVSPLFGSFIEQTFYEAWLSLPQNTGQYDIVPQYRLSPYRLDFAFPQVRVGIELDGHATHSSPDAIAHDRKRQRYIESQGWQVIRFGGKEVFTDAIACAEEAWKIFLRRMNKGMSA